MKAPTQRNPTRAALVFSAAILCSTLALVSCGNGSSPTMLAPTSTAATPGATAASAATIVGTVRAATSTNTIGSQGQSSTPLTVTIVGSSIGASVSGDGTFTLNGVPPGTATLEFKETGVDATLALGGMVSGEVRHISVTLTDAGAELNSDDHGGDNQGAETEIEGPITAKDSGALTITVNGQVVSVPIGTAITLGDAPLAFGDLKVGDQVKVNATSTNGTLVAQEIDVENSQEPPGAGGNEPPGDGDNNEQKVEGPVTGLSGACPNISFTVGSTLVTANAATTYDGTSCSVLGQTNRSVEVKGTRQSNGSLLATEIEMQD